MFDIGGWEFLVIIVVAVVVIGPKDLPTVIRTVSGWTRKARELAQEFQSGLNEIAREAELDSVRKDVVTGLGLEEGEDIGNRIRREVEDAVDPDGSIAKSFEVDEYLSDPLDDPDIDDLDPEEARRIRDAQDRAAVEPEAGPEAAGGEVSAAGTPAADDAAPKESAAPDEPERPESKPPASAQGGGA